MAAMLDAERARARAMEAEVRAAIEAGRAGAGLTVRIRLAVLALMRAPDVLEAVTQEIPALLGVETCTLAAEPAPRAIPPLPPGVRAAARRRGDAPDRPRPRRRGARPADRDHAAACRGRAAGRARCAGARAAGRWPADADRASARARPRPCRRGKASAVAGLPRPRGRGRAVALRHDRRTGARRLARLAGARNAARAPIRSKPMAHDAAEFLGFLTRHLGGEPDLAALGALRPADLRGFLAERAAAGDGGGDARAAPGGDPRLPALPDAPARHGGAAARGDARPAPEAAHPARADARGCPRRRAAMWASTTTPRGTNARRCRPRATWRCSPCSMAPGCASPRRWR